MLGWFGAQEAIRLGKALADQYAIGVRATELDRTRKSPKIDPIKILEDLLRRASAEISTIRLNFYKKAKLANTFKWRLLEQGIEARVADNITQALVMHVSLSRPATKPASAVPLVSSGPKLRGADLKALRESAAKSLELGEYAEAAANFRELVRIKPRDAEAHNLLGTALSNLGRHEEAISEFSKAIALKANFADPHINLGITYRLTGHFEKAELAYRSALKLKSGDERARTGLGMCLIALGRMGESKGHFAKILTRNPRCLDALIGMGQVLAAEGNFAEAEASYRRALEVEPRCAAALASLVGLRKMSSKDEAWIARAKEAVSRNLPPIDEANLRYAMGKYYDDLCEFADAFENYRRANDLMKGISKAYPRDAHTRFIDQLIAGYSRELLAGVGKGGSDSTLPLLVVGMPRSGTSLVEQIVAAHPRAQGAGELSFWITVARQYEPVLRQGRLLDSAIRKQIAGDYLQLLRRHSPDALRIVDKAPANTEYLGLIHSVFPKARFIYVRRDPVDTCLSCYFQPFSTALGFATDLSDLAHYYREFHRIMEHWRSALPTDSILDVRYEELVEDQERQTRKILNFIDLEWDERCLEFHRNQRIVATASAWQVRQRMYRASVNRSRNYNIFVGPLLPLRELEN